MAYFFLFFFWLDFLSFHILNKNFFKMVCMQLLQVRVAIFGMHVDNLYGGTENQPSPAHPSLIFCL